MKLPPDWLDYFAHGAAVAALASVIGLLIFLGEHSAS